MKEKGTLGYGKLCNASSLRDNPQSFYQKVQKKHRLVKTVSCCFNIVLAYQPIITNQ
jgi:hypothetical protein